MPPVSVFYNIRIAINYRDHNPPHFHASYNEYEMVVGIVDLSIIAGHFPPNGKKLVLRWAKMHQVELLRNWKLAMENRKLVWIDPLE